MVTADQVWAALDEIPDPEIPVISLVDLGVIRDVTVDGDTVRVEFTPTFLGCPALEVMRRALEETVARARRRAGGRGDPRRLVVDRPHHRRGPREAARRGLRAAGAARGAARRRSCSCSRRRSAARTAARPRRGSRTSSARRRAARSATARAAASRSSSSRRSSEAVVCGSCERAFPDGATVAPEVDIHWRSPSAVSSRDGVDFRREVGFMWTRSIRPALAAGIFLALILVFGQASTASVGSQAGAITPSLLTFTDPTSDASKAPDITNVAVTGDASTGAISFAVTAPRIRGGEPGWGRPIRRHLPGHRQEQFDRIEWRQRIRPVRLERRHQQG